MYDFRNPERSKELLKLAVKTCLKQATDAKLRSISFEAHTMATGKWEVAKSLEITTQTIVEFFNDTDLLSRDIDVVRIVAEDDNVAALAKKTLLEVIEMAN